MRLKAVIKRVTTEGKTNLSSSEGWKETRNGDSYPVSRVGEIRDSEIIFDLKSKQRQFWWKGITLTEVSWRGNGVESISKCKINLRKMSSFSSVQFSRSVVSDSLWPHELQHARLPCPSPTPGVHSNSRPSSRWCHPAISSSVAPFSSCPHYKRKGSVKAGAQMQTEIETWWWNCVHVFFRHFISRENSNQSHEPIVGFKDKTRQ